MTPSDPTVTRKSGFLPPRFASSSELGQQVEVPYFFNLAPNRDLTLAPIFTTKERVALQAEYRSDAERAVELLEKAPGERHADGLAAIRGQLQASFAASSPA